MLINKLIRAESIPDILIFIEIKILELLEAFLIYIKKLICFLRLKSPYRIWKYNIKIKILELLEAFLI